MSQQTACPLSDYQELEPLCEKGHVVLIRNLQDGQLYVKKRVQSFAFRADVSAETDPFMRFYTRITFLLLGLLSGG